LTYLLVLVGVDRLPSGGGASGLTKQFRFGGVTARQFVEAASLYQRGSLRRRSSVKRRHCTSGTVRGGGVA
jgi:hypothetical protein